MQGLRRAGDIFVISRQCTASRRLAIAAVQLDVHLSPRFIQENLYRSLITCRLRACRVREFSYTSVSILARSSYLILLDLQYKRTRSLHSITKSPITNIGSAADGEADYVNRLSQSLCGKRATGRKNER